MKTIIVPTDYSENAQNATEYAAALAKITKAKIYLLHVYKLPAVIDGVPSMIDRVPLNVVPLQEIAKNSKAKLKRLAKNLNNKFNIEVESDVYPGFISEILPDYVNKKKGDLVVMGMRGMNKAQKLLMGSITTNILKKAFFPLLIVPASSKFHPIKHILLACDFHADSVNKKLKLVKDSAFIFNADIRTLHMGHKEVEVAEMEERIATGQQLERIFKGVRHSYSHLEEEDVVEGILSCIKAEKTDLLVMIPRKRSFWQSLTSRSNTKRIAFNVDIPLLALPHSDN